jgi:hypothetical protein
MDKALMDYLTYAVGKSRAKEVAEDLLDLFGVKTLADFREMGDTDQILSDLIAIA